MHCYALNSFDCGGRGLGVTQRDEYTTGSNSKRPSAAPSSAAHEALTVLIRTIQESSPYERLLHPALDIIEHYDHENQTDLLNTLEVYLENDCNAQKCGRLLFLHRNSLVYRIHRVQEISSCDLFNPEERSYLRISFLLRR